MATPEEMAASMRANLKEKTGKTMAQWLKLTKAAKLEKHGQIVKLLKSEHGVGHGYANLIAHETLGGLEDAPDPFGGKKAALKPIHDAILKAVKRFGKDVEVSPKKTYISLRRNKQFALIQPSTLTRVDVGLSLNGVPATERLEDWGGMCTHRVRVTETNGVDAELKAWLKQAYEAS